GRCVSDENMRLSDSICTGLQLANFWQDVRRDYDRGRIYIPQEICRQHDWNECRFAAGKCDPAFRELLRPLVDQADSMLAACLPRSGAAEPLKLRLHRLAIAPRPAARHRSAVRLCPSV